MGLLLSALTGRELKPAAARTGGPGLEQPLLGQRAPTFLLCVSLTLKKERL